MFQFINTFIGELTTVPYMILCFVPFKENMRFSKKTIPICMIVLSASAFIRTAVILIFNFHISTAHFMSYVTIAFALLLFIILIKTSIYNRLYVFFVVATYALTVSLIASHVVARYFSHDFETYSSLTQNLSHASLLALTMPFVWKFMRDKIGKAINCTAIAVWKFMWIIPLMFVLIISIYIGIYSADYMASLQFLMIVVLFLLCSFMVYYVVIFMVVKTTDATKLEHELALQTVRNESLKAASKAKSDFLAVISHEIRTPMNAIIGITQMQLQTLEEHEEAIEKIYSAGNTLLGIINDILDMSKIEMGKLELNPVEYDIPSLINDTVQLNLVRIASKPIDFILEIDETLPNLLIGDELRLKQILNNLLSNAIKYTDKGIVRLSVSHVPVEDGIMLRFVVEDTGQGMKEEDTRRLFSEYLRFNTEANRITEGTGLGLSITKQLVEMMDGIIQVESKYGKGSTFTVAIKQKAVECSAIGAELAGQLRSFKYTNMKQYGGLQIAYDPMPYGRVLVVDDVDSNLYVAHGLLTPYKLKIETVNSGYATIGKIEGGSTYDIIFMDHMMPMMDGVETTKKLREFGYTGIIIALTANALVGNKEMFKQNGFDGFITKPIDIRHLNDILIKYIRDKYPEEAKKYKAESVMHDGLISTRMNKIFCREAKEAVLTLQKTLKNGDIKLFTITVHAMKSALVNVGEQEASMVAYSLEKAGHDGDIDFIAAKTEHFIGILEALVEKLRFKEALHPEEADCVDDADIVEDRVFLHKQLQIMKTACEDYDKHTVYKALDQLKQKTWKRKTTDMLEDIYDDLYLRSDYEGVAKKCEILESN